jgi:hypothetical protein
MFQCLKWFMFTLNRFKGFELKIKKENCANKFGTKYYDIWNFGFMRGHPLRDDTFLVYDKYHFCFAELIAS